MHDVRYDAVHDEIVVPVPYAQAILTFRGGADGQEAPIRIIQGPKTGAIGSRLDVDPVHNEIFTYTGNRVTVYPREANGDVAPIRVIKGPKTGIKSPPGIALDSKLGELYVANMGTPSITVFPVTANGDVPPSRTIRGGPAGAVGLMIGNPGAVGYDSKRDQILVPN